MKKLQLASSLAATPDMLVQPVAGFSTSPTFRNSQSFGKALKKLYHSLPKSPCKAKLVVCHIADDVQFASTSPTKRHKVALSSATETLVNKWYCHDDISRVAPGKKDYVTIITDQGNEKVQKKNLLMTVAEAYELFKHGNPTVKIGKSKFVQLRPKYVLPVSDLGQNVCLCKHHENFDLLL